jgi:hypothetical protein
LLYPLSYEAALPLSPEHPAKAIAVLMRLKLAGKCCLVFNLDDTLGQGD